MNYIFHYEIIWRGRAACLAFLETPLGLNPGSRDFMSSAGDPKTIEEILRYNRGTL
jgi:hypothetical protein